MNKPQAALLACVGIVTCLAASLTAHADDLGINVILEGEVTPGVYGRVEVGNNSHPSIYYPEPRIVVKESRYAKSRPVYLHVPPGHAKNWGKHCHKYHACERPVYFIKSVEYEESYQHEHSRNHDRDSKKSENKGGNKEKGNGKKHDKH